MLTLRQEPLDQDLTIKEMAMWDTKANILEGYRLMGCEISKSYTKDVLTTILEDLFEHQFGIIADAIPHDEIHIISELLQNPREHYVEVKRDDSHHLNIQKLHLVVTYIGPTTWHIYMPDSIRERIKQFFDQSLVDYPGLQEFNRLVDEANSLRDEIDKFLFSDQLRQLLDILTAPQSPKPNTADPKSESAKAKYYDKKLRELKQGFKSVEPRIQGLPPGSIQKILDNLDSYIEAVDKVKQPWEKND